MSTPTPRTKPIDLSKCKVGQRMKMSDKRTTEIIAIDKDSKKWPFNLKGCGWYNSKGDSIAPTYQPAVVAILPLLKKAGKPGKPGKKKDNLKEVLAAFNAAHAAFTKELNRLKGLLKP